MSTKNIEEALEALQRYADADGHDGYWNLALTARQDLEAIRRVARAYMRDQRSMSDAIAIDRLMESIAKDAANG